MVDSVEPIPGALGDVVDGVTVALADKRRRYVLHHLAVNDDPASVAELAERLVEWGDYDRGTIETTLLHRHLPKMVEAGLLTVDNDDDTVVLSSKGERANRIRSASTEQVARACR